MSICLSTWKTTLGNYEQAMQLQWLLEDFTKLPSLVAATLTGLGEKLKLQVLWLTLI